MKDVIYIYERGRNKRICFNDFLIAKYLHTELGYTNVRIDGKRYWYNDSIQGHIDSIRKQRVSSIFYLPSSTDMEESMVLMDHITHYDNKLIDPKIFCQNKIRPQLVIRVGWTDLYPKHTPRRNIKEVLV